MQGIDQDRNQKRKRFAELNENNIDMYTWIVDGSGKYTGLAWLGSACHTGTGGFSKTSVSKGPSRRNAIVETAEVSVLTTTP